MPMVFPSSPTVGQVFSSGGRSWVWTGSTWDSPAGSPFVAPGLNLITSQSFTNQSQIDLLNVFSANYDTYKLIFTAAAVSSQFTVDVRLRSSSGAVSSANYNRQQVFFRDTLLQGFRSNSQTSWIFSVIRNIDGQNFTEMIISNPFQSTPTQFFSRTVDNLSGVSIQDDAGVFTATTSMTGLTIYASSGMTGTVQIYGMRK